MRRNLIWLASYPKSGNTWLRVFLHNYLLQPATPYSINRLTEVSAVENAAAFFAVHDPRPATAYTTAAVQALRPLVHRDLTQLHDGPVFVKTHNARLAMHGIHLCTPAVTAGAIYIIRDPRDVAVSFAHHTGRSIDEIITFMNAASALRATAAQVFDYLGPWSGHVASWAGSPNLLVLRYEDMLATPAVSFETVINFLGRTPDLQRLQTAIRFSAFETLQAQEDAEGYNARAPDATSRFFRNGSDGTWREILTATQQQRIEADHGNMMQRFDYLKN